MDLSKARRIFRGDIDAGTAALEALRRARVLLGRRRERVQLVEFNRRSVRLSREYANATAYELLAHFRTRNSPTFFSGFTDLDSTIRLQRQFFTAESEKLIQDATVIAQQHCWPLLGFGEKCFGVPEIDWNLDPLSGINWPTDYHADINLIRRDGSDARVLWEFNRLAHLLKLGRAYALTKDEQFSGEFQRQVSSWRKQNPVGRGVNWNCAMEVALRSINLLGAFMLFLQSPEMTEELFMQLLTMFDQHGGHIARNLEFSHIATSNHYLCDVTVLLWLGIMLPELEQAVEWRDFGLRELLREMDKQILADGADYEASTGYHRLKVELFLYSFVLCRANGIEIDEKHWRKLGAMIDYLRVYLRPDGKAPIIGDSDSGQCFPIVKRDGDDHAYLLALGASVFSEPRFKHPAYPIPEELLWITGPAGITRYQSCNNGEQPKSEGFPDAGVYILRDEDLCLLLNAGGAGVNGRGSHGHNDKLSIEVSAYGTAFIVDPGTYVYTADLHERHLFRSTAFHSTVEVDGAEQNTIDEAMPFVIGNEARPYVLRWEPGADRDLVCAEHYGYRRLREPVTHRRSVTFHRREQLWILDDEFCGFGQHEFITRFHFNAGLAVRTHGDSGVAACDEGRNVRLLVWPLAVSPQPKLEEQFTSRDYGAKESCVSVAWTVATVLPYKMSWAIVPVCANDDEAQRLRLPESLRRL